MTKAGLAAGRHRYNTLYAFTDGEIHETFKAVGERREWAGFDKAFGKVPRHRDLKTEGLSQEAMFGDIDIRMPLHGVNGTWAHIANSKLGLRLLQFGLAEVAYAELVPDLLERGQEGRGLVFGLGPQWFAVSEQRTNLPLIFQETATPAFHEARQRLTALFDHQVAFRGREGGYYGIITEKTLFHTAACREYLKWRGNRTSYDAEDVRKLLFPHKPQWTKSFHHLPPPLEASP